MQKFMSLYSPSILGVLSGFDRLVFRGTLRGLAYLEGMRAFLWRMQILLKDFADFVHETTDSVKEASLRSANAAGRPVIYLTSSRTSKEDVARQVLERDDVESGLICVLKAVEPCWSYEIHRCREKKRLELRPAIRKCLHLYHYFHDQRLGVMSARIQTWFPFNIQICLNGREWLGKQMEKADIGFHRSENCFTWVDDLDGAQSLLDRQLRISWPSLLDRIARTINPVLTTLFASYPQQYYWSVYQSEWATDILFRDPRSLARIYPRLVHHAITSMSCRDIMRFLGRKLNGAFKDQIVSGFVHRPEGVRVKHRAGSNSIKVYDKQGSVLRVETTINDPHDFRVFRPKEGDPNGPCSWRIMRKGIADIHRRAKVSQAANQRYIEALTPDSETTTLKEVLAEICQPTTWRRRRARALRPWDDGEASLLAAVASGQFLINGFRNRDLVNELHPDLQDSEDQRRKAAACITRKIRLLRAHGLVRKVPKTHRYLLTAKGRRTITPLLAAREAPTSLFVTAA